MGALEFYETLKLWPDYLDELIHLDKIDDPTDLIEMSIKMYELWIRYKEAAHVVESYTKSIDRFPDYFLNTIHFELEMVRTILLDNQNGLSNDQLNDLNENSLVKLYGFSELMDEVYSSHNGRLNAINQFWKTIYNNDALFDLTMELEKIVHCKDYEFCLKLENQIMEHLREEFYFENLPQRNQNSIIESFDVDQKSVVYSFVEARRCCKLHGRLGDQYCNVCGRVVPEKFIVS